MYNMQMAIIAARRRIPASEVNLFQLIYVLIREYQERSGLDALNLSLGNPDTIPNEAIRRLQAKYALDPGYDYHTYAEDKNLHGFAEAMVELHSGVRANEYEHLRCLPIAGIKTASAMMPLACGPHLPDRLRRNTFRVVINQPAYDIIGTWSSYFGIDRIVWPLAAEDGMRLNLERLKDSLRHAKVNRPDLIFVIRPGNPASVGVTREEWKQIIEFCLDRGSRLVNDAAYAGLAGESHVPLAAVAKDYPELEWMELYSVSKSFSDPGARLGALVGTSDFVEDFRLIKGNTDSGPVPSVMAAYGEFLSDRAAAKEALRSLCGLYERRLAYLIPKLKKAGLREACPTEAGFFTLWKVPRKVLGLDLAKQKEPPHEAFNRRVIAETGIVGVHFLGPEIEGRREPFIRYTVCTDVLNLRFQERFEGQLKRLRPEYD